jgi:hypothetical protein
VQSDGVRRRQIGVVDFHSHAAQYIEQGANVGYVGHVVQDHRLVGEQSRCQHRLGRVLIARGRHLAMQGIAPFNDQSFHFSPGGKSVASRQSPVASRQSSVVSRQSSVVSRQSSVVSS